MATISDFPTEFKDDEFIIDGVVYKWMSISDMEADSRIMEVNEDIVRFVKSNCS